MYIQRLQHCKLMQYYNPGLTEVQYDALYNKGQNGDIRDQTGTFLPLPSFVHMCPCFVPASLCEVVGCPCFVHNCPFLVPVCPCFDHAVLLPIGPAWGQNDIVSPSVIC